MTQTPDLAGEQIARLRTLFPECVSEGRVDFDRLRATLGDLDALAGENLRIACARRHFGAIEVAYDDVTGAEGFRERFLRGGG